MSLKLEDNEILLEFPLTQAKRAWKIRKRDGRKKPPDLRYLIEEGDYFEWMITNEEVRDMLSALRCISPQSYKEIKELVLSVSQFNAKVREEIGRGISLEASLLPKQWKRAELTPYLFVLLRLDETTDEHYLIDKRGRLIEKTLGYKLKAGDKLVWVIKQQQIKRIILALASLDEFHKGMVKEKIISVLEN